MLKIDQDRLDYSELLTPPAEYRMQTAVGTTYSLNLETLMGAPLALALEGSSAEGEQQDLLLLEVIRKNAGKIHLFCEAGKISVPMKERKVLSLLENSVTQVNPPRGKSFHPKVWVVEYLPEKKKDRPFYRVMVLSRNLTFDRSWDLAAVLEGYRTENIVEANKPLTNFIAYLNRFQKRGKQKRAIKELANAVLYADFEPQLRGKKYFYHYELLPLGIGEDESAGELLDNTFHDLVVISPFLTGSVIDGFKKKRLKEGRITLISRIEALRRLERELLEDIDCWHLKDMVIEGESMLDTEEIEHSKQDLHAKLYLKTKSSWSELWIGSANCTHSAFNGNIEFLIKLNCYYYQYNKDKLLGDLMGEEADENPFEKWVPQERNVIPEDVILRELDLLAGRIAGYRAKAEVLSEDTTHRYRLQVTFTNKLDIPENTEVNIAPLMRPGLAKAIENTLCFDDIGLSDISMFYRIEIKREGKELKFVMKIHTSGIPDQRDAAIFKEIIGNRQGFFQYVSLILGEDMTLTLAEILNFEKGANWVSKEIYEYRPVLYEKMLKASAQNPERLQELEDIMVMLSEAAEGAEDIVPDDFRELMNVFRNTVWPGR